MRFATLSCLKATYTNVCRKSYDLTVSHLKKRRLTDVSKQAFINRFNKIDPSEFRLSTDKLNNFLYQQFKLINKAAHKSP